MKIVLLAGGYGTRISEETTIKPKPMVEIGGMPIIWHIMKLYSKYGYNDFIICLGYKGYIIKEYFNNYFLHKSDVEIDLKNNKIKTLDSASDNWKITLVDTGLKTMTGGRIKRVKKYIGNNRFMFTYGDGLSNINIDELVSSHEKSNKEITVSAIQPIGRFGELKLNSDNSVKSFIEKPKNTISWINGGFFVCEPSVFDYIDNDFTIFEREPMEKLAYSNKMNAYLHNGFWKPMDTLRDKIELNELWKNNPPWKVW